MGLNFFGTSFSISGPKAVIGKQYLEILDRYQPTLIWDTDHAEHSFTFKQSEETTTCYYPSLQVSFISFISSTLTIRQFIADRLELANTLEVGISIWDLGQGLDYFFDLI